MTEQKIKPATEDGLVKKPNVLPRILTSMTLNGRQTLSKSQTSLLRLC